LWQKIVLLIGGDYWLLTICNSILFPIMTGLTLWVTQMFAWLKHQRRSKHCGNGHQRLLLHGGSEAALAAPIHHRFRDQHRIEGGSNVSFMACGRVDDPAGGNIRTLEFSEWRLAGPECDCDPSEFVPSFGS